ncbi:MAG: DUF5667 domain-containing protein, partial [Candidatus Pacebacteria bacterium]|nr:DUF5667 domain-containing protein [Candidatus Paceibacterota bacterium]
MNNDNLEKFIADIESIKMTQYEKNEIRNELMSFAINYEMKQSPYAIASVYARRIIATAFIAIISIGSLSQYASSDALPGDTLYPVKIAHENLKVATTSGNTKKINYEITRTEKRIQEAAKLAQKDKLDEEKQQEIAKAIDEQTTRVKKQIESVKETDPESALKLNSELKSTIKANSEALRKLTTKKVENPTEEKIDSEENTNEEVIEEENPVVESDTEVEVTEEDTE